ncbi:MAG: 4Fe-4S dicluster domain-containing protein [Methanobrevibacter olleyae]|uniref:4Fe-4S dicluster domain-containing protein n=1 Tax=Methanobrevibacter olleyae TaxID=294671 RepID=A0A8T3VTE2_METOL|nr:4Fe-4S dicluster domain-containing protein [Methanobrevibacter olleyae]
MRVISGDYMEEDMKRFGFGFMRLPRKGFDIDYEKTNQMVDKFIESGANFFDTGYDYLGGESEIAIRESVVKRYPRDEILISDKMPVYSMSKGDDPEEIFKTQLERCGVDYFDYYLVHDPEDRYYGGLCNELDIFNLLSKYKNEGKIRRLGLSLHDSPKVLDKILTEHPEMEFVLLQVNYKDWFNPSLETDKLYDVAKDHGIPVFVMGPLKGGSLARVNKDVSKLFKEYENSANGNNDFKSPSDWAFSFVFNLDNVDMVLSGISNIDEMERDIEFIQSFKKLNGLELRVINKARELSRYDSPINCSTCDYCVGHCPIDMPISKYFDLYNLDKNSFELESDVYDTYKRISENSPKASQCIGCGNCEDFCPQHLKISDEMKKVSALFD